MKNYLILNKLYKLAKEINEKTFVGFIEGVRNESEALYRAKKQFKSCGNDSLIAEECFIQI